MLILEGSFMNLLFIKYLLHVRHGIDKASDQDRTLPWLTEVPI